MRHPDCERVFAFAWSWSSDAAASLFSHHQGAGASRGDMSFRPPSQYFVGVHAKVTVDSLLSSTLGRHSVTGRLGRRMEC